METTPDTDAIVWRTHLRSAPEKVFDFLGTAAGRRRFWAESASEDDGVIEFVFSDGTRLESKILERRAPERFALTYFGGSAVTFELAPDGNGGTDLRMIECHVPEAERRHNMPGWVSLLLTFKAAVDFDVDLRNHDARRSWKHGYVDP